MDTNIEVEELGSRTCATRAKTTAGLGLLARHYMKNTSQAPQAPALMRKFTILMEDGSMPTLRAYPARPAIPRKEIIKEVARLWCKAGERI